MSDIKANNIMVRTTDGPHGLVVEQTQLTDLEDGAHCPLPGNFIGAQLGNWMWRSPEAHAEGPINKPSDIFAFAIVVSRECLPLPLIENIVSTLVIRSAYTPWLNE